MHLFHSCYTIFSRNWLREAETFTLRFQLCKVLTNDMHKWFYQSWLDVVHEERPDPALLKNEWIFTCHFLSARSYPKMASIHGNIRAVGVAERKFRKTHANHQFISSLNTRRRAKSCWIWHCPWLLSQVLRRQMNLLNLCIYSLCIKRGQSKATGLDHINGPTLALPKMTVLVRMSCVGRAVLQFWDGKGAQWLRNQRFQKHLLVHGALCSMPWMLKEWFASPEAQLPLPNPH